jgi:hypothetical protein
MGDRDRDKSQDSDKHVDRDRDNQQQGQNDRGRGTFSEGDWGDKSSRVSDTHEPPDPPSEKK